MPEALTSDDVTAASKTSNAAPKPSSLIAAQRQAHSQSDQCHSKSAITVKTPSLQQTEVMTHGWLD